MKTRIRRMIRILFDVCMSCKLNQHCNGCSCCMQRP